MSNTLKQKSFPNLDKIRGIAALSVVLYHVIELTQWADYPTSGLMVWGRIGWMGVDIFFVLSGMVITHSAYLLYENDKINWITAYWTRRLCRIVPLYFMTCAIFITLVQPQWIHLSISKLLWHMGTHLLFIHNLFPGTHGSLNGANWSIGLEMQFYALITFILPWIIRRNTLTLLVIFLVTSWIWRGLTFLALRDQEANLIFQYSTQLPGTIDQFGIGIVLCKALNDKNNAFENILKKRPIALLTGSSVLFSIMLYLYFMNSIYWNSFFMVVFFRTLIGFSAACLILTSIFCIKNKHRIFSEPLDFLGKISYGIYLWHLPVIISLQRIDTKTGYEFLGKTITLTIFLAIVSYYLFEKLWMRTKHLHVVANHLSAP